MKSTLRWSCSFIKKEFSEKTPIFTLPKVIRLIFTSCFIAERRTFKEYFEVLLYSLARIALCAYIYEAF
jgi:hypothetical protein